METGDSVQFCSVVPGSDGPSVKNFTVNVMSEVRGLEYYTGVLLACGYRDVGPSGRALETWEQPDGVQASAVHFLFMQGIPLPIATSTDRSALACLKDALEFIESGQGVYEIKTRKAPGTS